MRRMLDPKEAGGSLPSTIEFDKDGNRKVTKDLGVDGKLKLKSLVSASNPDGDITKELGGGGGGGEGSLYLHSMYLSNSVRNAVVVNVYNHSSTKFTIDSFKQWLSNRRYPCSGAISGGESQFIPFYIYYVSGENSLACDAIDLVNHSDIRVMIGSFSLTDYVIQVQ